MTTTELLTHLRNLNVTLSADNGQLIFNGPKGALTAKLRAELSERKGEILEILRNTTANCVASTEPILRRVSRDRKRPLSFAQQRLWFLNQLEPGSATYNVPGALRIKGSLDVGVLKRSLEEIVRRHEALRTTFSIVDGEPVQVITPPLSFSLPVVDISHISDSEPEAEAQRLATEGARKPFDLNHGPLFRPTLIRLGEDDHVLLLTLHHIVSDAWSMGVLYHELTVLYQAFVNAETSPLADLPIQYADFAAWQREWLQGEVLESQLSYWKKQLDGSPVVLNLPSDRPRPTIQSFRGARQSIELSPELTKELKTLSRKEGVTLYMTLLAVFQTLLHRYTGQDDIVVGSPIANRNRIEIEGLIGFFVNTLVLRTDYSGNPTFRELLHRMRETALEAYAHQDLPFEKLVEELRPDRDLSRSPLFQAMFVYQNAPVKELSFEGLTVTPIRIAGEISKFDLTLSVNETRAGLRASLQYNVDLFDEATITRMLGHFRNLLEGVVANPERRISELPLLTQPEKHQLLVEWNETKADYPKDKCIHELFEEQAERTPETVAVVFEVQQLTYRELNIRANQLGHYLRKLGVGPEVLVGVCVERSIEMVVGLLGILKAGGAYVPLDSSYPAERLLYMLRDCDARILLTSEKLSEQLRDYEGQRVCLDRATLGISCESTTNLSNEADVSHLAYVIYTSGSTGNPKGVMIPHRAISNHMMWMLEDFPLNQNDRVAQRTPFSFDASVWEFFAPLISGAQLVLASPEASGDAESLVEFLQKEHITVLQVVPTLLQMLLDQKMERCTSLRRVFCGGEPLSAELCNRFRRRMTVPLINLYGPTEAAIDATSYAFSESDSHGWMPIGRPIANTQVYILDQYLAPAPIGVVGEICIGGLGLARGYLNQPELTAEKFIYHSFEGEPARRLYKTGDLARYLPDGNIEFLGRIDNQVKLRGYRIELGEIEAVLGQNPTVQNSVVVVREDEPGDKRLVAYVVALPKETFDASEVRKYLKHKLPEYMVPSVFMLLASLPQSPNGKVDKKALPALDKTRLGLGEAYSSPRTPVEELLAQIWSDVLKLIKVGIHDNFFALGGHSLLATQIVSRVRSGFSIDLPLRDIFAAPTIHALAQRVQAYRQETNVTQGVQITRVARDQYRVRKTK